MWSDISIAIRRLQEDSLHMQKLVEGLKFELFIFSRQLKMKHGIDDVQQLIVQISNDLWFRGMEVKDEEKKRQNAKEDESSPGG